MTCSRAVNTHLLYLLSRDLLEFLGHYGSDKDERQGGACYFGSGRSLRHIGCSTLSHA